jgi:ADP-heptose:LPS heptosyltransferase
VRVVPFQQRKAEGQAYRDVPTAAEAYDHGLTYLSLPPMLDPEVERTARPAWLKPHQATVDKLRAEISPDGRPVVGLAWTSGMRTGSRAKKYPNLEAVAEAVRDLDAHVVSIQYGRTRADIRALKELGVPVLSIDRLDLKNNLEAQAALGAACDKVVGVANASVALAAATGVSCFMFSTHQGWSALGQSYLPWYRDVRLFSQGDDGDWMPAARAMRAALGEELEALRA